MFYNNPLQEEADMIASEQSSNDLLQKETVINFCIKRLPILYKRVCITLSWEGEKS